MFLVGYSEAKMLPDTWSNCKSCLFGLQKIGPSKVYTFWGTANVCGLDLRQCHVDAAKRKAKETGLVGTKDTQSWRYSWARNCHGW